MSDQSGYQIQQIVDSTWDMAIIRAIEIVEEEMRNTSPDTGHGKAQRAFANRILNRFREL